METLKDLINEARTQTDDDAIAQLQCAAMAFGYWLYRQEGCPYGDNHEGLAKWCGERFEEYERLCDR